MVGAEMLTNGREEYQMTPGDWEGGTEQKVTQCCLKVSHWLPFSLSISVFISLYLCEGVIMGVKDHPPLVRKSLIDAFSVINTNILHNKNNPSSINKSTIWQTSLLQRGPRPRGSD